jgi:hypothetical protein
MTQSNHPQEPNRRDVLCAAWRGAAAALAGATALSSLASLSSATARADGGGVKTNQPMSLDPPIASTANRAPGSLGTPSAAGAGAPTATMPGVARVVRTTSNLVCSGHGIESTLVRDFLEEGLCALTATPNSTDAWHRLLRPDDVILVKCNQSARDTLGTTPPVVDELLRSLVAAGFSLEQIMVLEAGDLTLLRKTRQPDYRWQGTAVDFGSSGSDTFLAALDQATAIINVPFLKTHVLATMTGCLKNLSHGLIRHPARFHANGCDPAIGQIVASPPIRSKLRLNVVNALRVIFDRGPDARVQDIHCAGTMLFSTDPVAADSVGLGILNSVRSDRGLGPLFADGRSPRQLFTAHRLGLGQCDGSRIETVSLTF